MGLRNYTAVAALGLGTVFMVACAPELPSPPPAQDNLPAIDYDADNQAAYAMITANIDYNEINIEVIPVTTTGECINLGISVAKSGDGTLDGGKVTMACIDKAGKVTAQLSCYWTGTGSDYKYTNEKPVQTVRCVRPGTSPGIFIIEV